MAFTPPEKLTFEEAFDSLSNDFMKSRLRITKDGLTGDQMKALRGAYNFVRNFDPTEKKIYTIAGYAGTGKSTVIAVLVRLLHIGGLINSLDDYYCVTPTNKSKNVLALKGHSVAATIFSQFFITIDLSMNEEQVRRLINYFSDLFEIETDGKDEAVLIEEINEVFMFLSKVEKTAATKFKDSMIPDFFTEEDKEKFEGTIPLPQNAEVGERDDSLMFLFKQPSKEKSVGVIDEGSMMTDSLLESVTSKLDIPFIQFGDSGQLSPVLGPPNSYLLNPDKILKENKRAEDPNSLALRIALEIRTGRKNVFNLGEIDEGNLVRTRISKFFKDPDNLEFMFTEVDQIIAGKNATVDEINEMAREILDYKGKYPNEGEKIISKGNFRDEGIFNGDMFIVNKVHEIDEKNGYILADIVNRDNGALFQNIQISMVYFNPAITKRIYYKKLKNFIPMRFSYCITCHASQGSEFEKIVVIEEPIGPPKNWLYTAYTRTKDLLISLY